jgi:hypothetical protein
MNLMNMGTTPCYCHFCNNKKELDWIELITGANEDPWKFIKRGE